MDHKSPPHDPQQSPLSIPPSTDLSVFQNTDNHQPPSNCTDYKTCICVKRILTGLQYYTSLDVISNNNHRDLFSLFIDDIYNVQSVIMDFYHLRKQHGDQIWDIMNYALNYYQFQYCNIDLCSYSDRLYRVNQSNTNNNIDGTLKVMTDLLDGIHHHLFHSFETGFRLHLDNNDNDIVDDEHDVKDMYYDSKYAMMRKRISATRNKTQRFKRVTAGNKFSVNIGENFKNDNYSDQVDDSKPDHVSDTYLDELFDHLKTSNIKEPIIDKLITFLSVEQYDTEALAQDLDGPHGESNIALHLADKDCIDCVDAVLNKSKRMISDTSNSMHSHTLCTFILFVQFP